MKLVSDKKGFTLVELLVAISIIAVLTTLLVPNLFGARGKAQDTKKVQDAISLKNALRLYYNDFQTYPQVGGVDRGACSGLAADPDMQKYMENIIGIGCTYYRENNGDSFRLCVPVANDNAGEGINSQKRCGIEARHCGTTGVGETIANMFEVCAN